MIRAAVALLVAACPLSAQARGAQGEFRAEAYATGAMLVGAGFVTPIGTYARVGLAGAAGSYVDAPRTAAARGEALMRFHLDPFRQSRRTLYAAAGVSAQRDQDERWRPYLLARIGVEGRARSGWFPAAEIGLGGGGHVAIVLRKARRSGR